MAWNNAYAFKVLADMPTKLNAKNLEFLQSEIDKDKLATSIEMNRDLCGDYAPFCAFCDKKIKYPCAVALIKCKQAEGLQLEIAVTEDELPPDGREQTEEAVEAAKAETVKVAESGENTELLAEEEPVKEKNQKKIRIAIAKRKH